MTEKESLINEARDDMRLYNDLTVIWYMYPPEIVIAALIEEVKELREALK